MGNTAKFVWLLLAGGLVIGSLAGAAPVSASTPLPPGPEVGRNAHHDTSPPLHLIKGSTKQVPSILGFERNAKAFRTKEVLGSAANTPGGATATAAPAPGLGFDGIGNGVYGYAVTSAPPDTNGAVGPNHYVQIVNQAFAVFDKSGNLKYGPVNTNTIWSGFGGGCEANNDGDGTVEYDKRADRFVIQQFSVTTTPYLECVAVSTTSCTAQSGC